MSPTDPNKYLRGITTSKTDQFELICLRSKSRKTAKKNLENSILEKGNKSCKRGSSYYKTETWSVLIENIFKYQISVEYLKNAENWIRAKGNNSCKSKWSVTKPNLICIMAWQIHVPHFKQISQKTAEKSLED